MSLRLLYVSRLSDLIKTLPWKLPDQISFFYIPQSVILRLYARDDKAGYVITSPENFDPPTIRRPAIYKKIWLWHYCLLLFYWGSTWTVPEGTPAPIVKFSFKLSFRGMG